jgi:hypothetical protein
MAYDVLVGRVSRGTHVFSAASCQLAVVGADLRACCVGRAGEDAQRKLRVSYLDSLGHLEPLSGLCCGEGIVP